MASLAETGGGDGGGGKRSGEYPTAKPLAVGTGGSGEGFEGGGTGGGGVGGGMGGGGGAEGGGGEGGGGGATLAQVQRYASESSVWGSAAAGRS